MEGTGKGLYPALWLTCIISHDVFAFPFRSASLTVNILYCKPWEAGTCLLRVCVCKRHAVKSQVPGRQCVNNNGD